MKSVTTKWECSYDDCGVEHETVSYGPANEYEDWLPKGWSEVRIDSSYMKRVFCPLHRISMSNWNEFVDVAKDINSDISSEGHKVLGG